MSPPTKVTLASVNARIDALLEGHREVEQRVTDIEGRLHHLGAEVARKDLDFPPRAEMGAMAARIAKLETALVSPAGLGGPLPALELPADALPPVDTARFAKAPCYLCGYNSEHYYQPDTHPCAARFHAQHRAEIEARLAAPRTATPLHGALSLAPGGPVVVSMDRGGVWLGTYVGEAAGGVTVNLGGRAGELTVAADRVLPAPESWR